VTHGDESVATVAGDAPSPPASGRLAVLHRRHGVFGPGTKFWTKKKKKVNSWTRRSRKTYRFVPVISSLLLSYYLVWQAIIYSSRLSAAMLCQISYLYLFH
jgi:hypothetical protein